MFKQLFQLRIFPLSLSFLFFFHVLLFTHLLVVQFLSRLLLRSYGFVVNLFLRSILTSNSFCYPSLFEFWVVLSSSSSSLSLESFLINIIKSDIIGETKKSCSCRILCQPLPGWDLRLQLWIDVFYMCRKGLQSAFETFIFQLLYMLFI